MKFDPRKTIFLIDGSSFLYRSYYGLRPLHTPKGIPVQAVYSFCRMIKKLMKKFKPGYLAVVWDSKGPTTRHEMFDSYKATRQAPPSDLFDQKEYITEFCDLIDLCQIEVPGYEADDIMYSIAKEQTKKSYTIVFVTSDKDMAQALSDKVVMYDSFKDVITDPQTFSEKMGFPVEKLPFYFALLGDTSDNIPGVRGIGKKGATTLVQQFDSLQDMYDNLQDVAKDRTRNALKENKENAFLSEKLFLLQYHPSKLTEKDLSFDESNWAKARPLFAELNFKTLLKEIDEKEGTQLTIPTVPLEKKMVGYDFKLVNTQKDLKELALLLKKKKVFAVDTEGAGLNPFAHDLVGLSFAVDDRGAYYVPFGHNVDEKQLSREQVFKELKPILEDENIKKYLHNAKYDALVFANAGIDLNGIAFDSLLAAHLLLKEWQRIGLKHLSIYYFDEPMLSYEDVVKIPKRKNFSYVPLDLATKYSASDAVQTFKLAQLLSKKLKEEQLDALYYDLELPLSHILFMMEFKGIIVEPEILKEIGDKVTKELLEIEDEILEQLGDERKSINLNSPQQVEQLLFTDLGLPTQKKSGKTKRFSTDRYVLKTLSKLHPIPGLILKHRELSKLKSTYLDALPTYINPKTGRIHTSFRQTGVATGRLASVRPNLQNIPTDSQGYGIEIRRAFIPQEGHDFLSADYSQIELRVLAQLSKDKNLRSAFLKGHDIHAETAARLFDVPLEDVSHEQRQIGKRINFSILYGLTPYGLSKDLGIPFKDAKKYIEKYFEQYPGVSQWMEKIIDFVTKNGYVMTHWGRRRFVPGIYEANQALYKEARRVAINTVAQGTAAEIMKIGMLKLEGAFKKAGIDAYILLQIHDELLISVPKDKRKQAEKLVKEALESVVDWNIPLVVTTRYGKDWKEVTK